jgi:cell division protein YceG involved in septum cleavage
MAGVQDKDPPQQDRGKTSFFGRRKPLQSPAEALQPEAVPQPPGSMKRHSDRRPVLSALSGLLSLALVAAFVGLFAMGFVGRTLSAKGPLQTDKVVFIAPGTEVVQIIDKLNHEGVIDSPALVKLTLWVQGKWRKVKAGEYLFKANVSSADVIDILVAGKQLLHSVTIPEGLTSQQIVERLKAKDVLAGDIGEVPPEGSLLPETYKVARGSSRSQLIRIMRRQQDRLLTRIWNKRAKDLPLKTKYELLTLAAIVEKETGRADERSRVAAVFYNRLRKGMRLQSDPTIVYGLVGGKGTLGRPIQRSEIRKPTSYNTYVIPALPPGPIANPGRAALEATANPSKTEDLYFVANGTGGHAFAKTLAEHNQNVQAWRQIEKDRAAAKASGNAPAGAAPASDQVDRVTPGVEPEDPPQSRGRRGRRSELLPERFQQIFALSPFAGAGAETPGRGPSRTAGIDSIAERILLKDKLRASSSRLAAQFAAESISQPATPAIVVATELPAAVDTLAAPAAAKPVDDKVHGKPQVTGQKPVNISSSLATSEPVPQSNIAAAISAVNRAAGVTPPALPNVALGYAPVPAAALPGENKRPMAGGEVKKAPAQPKFNVVLAPGIETMNLQIIGVTPDVTDSDLDGPINIPQQDPEPEKLGKVATAPMSAAKRADMAARIKKFSASMPFEGGDIESRAQEIPDMKPVSRKALEEAAKRTRTAVLVKSSRKPVYDASAGTKLDPLKARRWDLNSAHMVPRLKTMRP